jgi:hypothetical protein
MPPPGAPIDCRRTGRTSLVRILLFLLCLTAGTARGAENAVTPGNIETKATFNCIGLRWDLKGDENGNATCRVKFRRQGTEPWRDALGLFRVRFRWQTCEMNDRGRDVNALSGSLFFLAPGTTYEIRLELADPDGGKEQRTLQVTTHELPHDPVGARIVNVRPGEFAGALAKAQPGDILKLEKGDHGPGQAVKVSGTGDKPIVIRGPEKGEASFRGTMHVSGTNLWFDRLTLACRVANANKSVVGFLADRSSQEVAITRCRIQEASYGVHVIGKRWFITDNWITGDKPKATGDQRLAGVVEVENPLCGEGIDFHHNTGGNDVAAYNQILYTADGVSYGDNNIDVYNNEISHNSDDNIEPDYAYDNYRVFHNRCWGAVSGVSFQPFNGGPWYIFGNQISGNGRHILKLKEGEGPLIFVGNTLVQPTPYKRFEILLQHGEGIFANNVWLQIPPDTIGHGDGEFDPRKLRLMDYNAYGTGGKPVWGFRKAYDLKALQQAGVDRHSRMVEGSAVLTLLPKNMNAGTGEPMLPRENAALIDSGLAITNLQENFLDQAPDLGAYEGGLGATWVGPRTYVAGGLAFGEMSGWKTGTVDRLPMLAPLGAPYRADNCKLLLYRTDPAAFLLVTFEPVPKGTRWARFDEILKGRGAQPGKVIRFLDSLAARLSPDASTGRSLVLLSGAQIDVRGVWNIQGGCDRKDIKAVQPDFFRFVASQQQTQTSD